METAIPRFRWLRRGLLGLLLLVVSLVALRVAWGLYAEWRLSAKIAEYRAAGEPVYPEDIVRPPLADEDNAAVFLRKAARQFVDGTFPSGQGLTDIVWEPWLLIDYPSEADRVIAANGGTLQSIAAARSARDCDFGFAANFSRYSERGALLPAFRLLSRAALAAALNAHLEQNDAESVELLRDAIAVADRSNQLGGMIGRMIGSSVELSIAAAIEFIATNLRDDSGIRYVNPQYAPRARILALQRELWNENLEKQIWRERCVIDRVEYMGCLREFLAGAPERLNPGSSGDWRGPTAAAILAPFWKMNALHSMHHFDRLVSDFTVPDWREMPDLTDLLTLAQTELTDWLLALTRPHDQLVTRDHLRALLVRRFAATAIAIRLYQLDHGRRPATLAELVPTYLPRVPRDLFAPGDVPIGYIGTGKQPRLYSVGTDGIDHGGVEPKSGDGYRGKNADILFQLDRDNIEPTYWGRQRAGKSNKTIDDNRDVECRDAENAESQPTADRPDDRRNQPDP